MKLFPYQLEGARWLASKRTALLADEPRLGKAVQSITALDLIGARTALVVCRGVARGNWAAEFERWSARGWYPQTCWGRGFKVRAGLYPTVVITSYEGLETVLKSLGAGFRFDCAVLDESHYIKNLEAKRSRLALGKDGVPAHADRVWLTTGTPTPNGLASELWVPAFVFGLTRLDFWSFAKKFCVVEDTGYGPRILRTRPEAIPELRRLLAPKLLRREAKDAAVNVQLPRISFSTVQVPPGKVDLGVTSFWRYAIPKDRSEELNKIVEKELGILNGILNGKAGPEVLEYLKAEAKSISTLRKLTALQKLDAACELIAEELDSGAYRKVVIFAHHRDCILGAMMRLDRFKPVSLYGGTSPARAERNIKKFQDPRSKTRVFIGQISAAGTSICLNAANHIFFLEESFVPDDNLQAAMRCGGVNQPLPIFVRTFCLAESYDYRLQTILREKMVQSAAILGNGGVPPELEDLI